MKDPARESATTNRSYGGVPAHERIAARRARLLAAGRELFGTQGVAATTVRRTYEAAGLSQRYFYESFRTVEALALAVADELAEEIFEQAARSVDGVSGERARIYFAFRTLIDYIAADPAAGRIMFIETAGNGPELATWRRQVLIRGAGLLEGWLWGPVEPDRVLDGGRDHQIATLMMAGGVVETIVSWLEGEIDATAEELADALARAVGAGPDAR